MQLNLKRPIVVFDLETTGLDVVKDRIVEISIVKISPDGKEEIKTKRINPTIHISEESTRIHHITDEDVKDAPTFKSIAKSLAQFIGGCDVAGFNSNKFDVPLLVEEFLRAGVNFDMKKRKFIDVQSIFHKMERRTLIAAYKFYCNKDLTKAHSAEADTIATYEVLKAQLDMYKDIEFKDADGKTSKPIINDVDALSEFSSQTKNVDFAGRIVYDKNGVEVINFGKHKGKSVEEVLKKEPSYYNWIMNNDFPLYTKKILTAIKLRGFNK